MKPNKFEATTAVTFLIVCIVLQNPLLLLIGVWISVAYETLKNREWRSVGIGILVVSLLAAGWYYVGHRPR